MNACRMAMELGRSVPSTRGADVPMYPCSGHGGEVINSGGELINSGDGGGQPSRSAELLRLGWVGEVMLWEDGGWGGEDGR